MSISLVRAAGLILFRKTGCTIEYLLLQASNLNHHWSPPKGHVDPGENDLETAIRETYEESGICKTDFKIMPDFKRELRYEAFGKPKLVTYWLAETLPEANVKISDEHMDYKWVTLQLGQELVADFKDMVQLLEECEEYLHKNTLPK